MRQLTKDQVLEAIVQSGSKPASFEIDDLRFAFNFKRVDGMAYAMAKAVMPSITERQMSYGTLFDMHNNIKAWCSENNVLYARFQDTYEFIMNDAPFN